MNDKRTHTHEVIRVDMGTFKNLKSLVETWQMLNSVTSPSMMRGNQCFSKRAVH